MQYRNKKFLAFYSEMALLQSDTRGYSRIAFFGPYRTIHPSTCSGVPPVKWTAEKNEKSFLQPHNEAGFLCGQHILGVLFSWSEYTQFTLIAFAIVVINIVRDHPDYFFTTGESVLVVPFSF